MSWGAVSTGFSDSYLAWELGKRYRGRVLLGVFGGATEPVTGFYHQVPAIQDPNDPKKMLRGYSTQLCHFEFDPEGTCRCGLCGMEDPLWDMLSDSDKYYRDFQQNVKGPKHFHVLTQHLLPIWLYEENAVKLIKQGHNLFNAIRKVFEVRGGNRDFLFWKTQEGNNKVMGTKYNVEGLDPSEFNPGVEFTADMLDWSEILRRELPGHPRFVLEYVKGNTPEGRPLPSRNADVDIKFITGSKFVVSTNISLDEGESTKKSEKHDSPAMAKAKAFLAQEKMKESNEKAMQQEREKVVVQSPDPGDEPAGEPGPEPGDVEGQDATGPMTYDEAVNTVCSEGNRNLGKTYREIADTNPSFFSWLISKLQSVGKMREKEAAIFMKNIIASGKWKKSDQNATNAPVQDPSIQDTQHNEESIDRETLVRQVTELLESVIGIEDENRLAQFMTECASDMSPLRRYKLNNWDETHLIDARKKLLAIKSGVENAENAESVG